MRHIALSTIARIATGMAARCVTADYMDEGGVKLTAGTKTVEMQLASSDWTLSDREFTHQFITPMVHALCQDGT